ncbi:MAG: response regulator [Patescibacteria group bacterium]|nr:response regulator [Patescibacteria group bacterium]
MPDKKITKPKEKTPVEKKTILIIEDDNFLSNMYRTKLELEGYVALTATNGEIGLKTAKEKRPNLILLDIIIPKMNGFEVLEGIKSDKNLKNIPVIMLTNLGQKDDIKKSFKLGADEYLIKAHFLPSEVVEKVKKFLK